MEIEKFFLTVSKFVPESLNFLYNVVHEVSPAVQSIFTNRKERQ